MRYLYSKSLTVCAVAILLAAMTLSASAARVSGELKKWHKVTIDFAGPKTSETATPNPFLDYRLDVTFTNGDKTLVVPGYFAADGNAANTSANSGNVWRVHFAPSATGTWNYTASFRTGKNVIADESANPGKSAGFMDGAKGSFSVSPTDKTGRDMRAKGLLQYVGKHHLRFAETGEYFLKCGADAPENFLAYDGFDGDFKTDGQKDDLVKNWAPHVKDWKPGDPTWQNGKGKGIIGAVNYLASEGMNVFSFLTMNIGGDDRNAFPYVSFKDVTRIDCSRMDQWGIVFEHGNNIGMYLHFKTMETENEMLLDKGNLGVERKLYYRELIARFGHNLALNWNLGEEINNASHEQKVAWADYFWTHDPYQHNIVIHNMGNPHYDLLGDASALTGFSLQTSNSKFIQVHGRTLDYINRSDAAGKPWVVACDEPGDATHALITDGEDPSHDNARKNALWGNFIAGGAGVEWYFGYKHPNSDLTLQDYRSRDLHWDQCRIALQFFQAYEVPFWDMKSQDAWSKSGDWILAGDKMIVAFLLDGGKSEIDLPAGKYAYGWFNPRTGEGMNALLNTGNVAGGSVKAFTAPDNKDWVLLLSKGEKIPASTIPATEVIEMSSFNDFTNFAIDGFAPAYKDGGRKVLAIDAAKHKDKFTAAEAKFNGKSGVYAVKLVTMTETDGESTYRVSVNGKQIGSFTNPATAKDYVQASQVFDHIALKKGDTLRVEFNSASNGKIPEGDAFAFSRGRWQKLVIGQPGTLYGWAETPGAATAKTPAPKPTAKPAAKAKPFVFDFDPKTAKTVFEEVDGVVAFEAENFAKQVLTDVRKWYKTSVDVTPDVKPDPDPNHAAGASDKTYLEILPDTRKDSSQKLIKGENFSDTPGKLGVLYYPVYFNNPGRYFVWVRICCTGDEDNGLHVGLDGEWPESGQRMQWIGQHGEWQWDSKQRTDKVHTGVRHHIWIDVDKPGLHTVMFSMREDGIELDKMMLTKQPKITVPTGMGPAERIKE